MASTNRLLTKQYNHAVERAAGLLSTRVGLGAHYTMYQTYSDNLAQEIVEYLVGLETNDKVKFYKNKITMNQEGAKTYINSELIPIEAKDIPVIVNGKDIYIGLTQEELTNYEIMFNLYPGVTGIALEMPILYGDNNQIYGFIERRISNTSSNGYHLNLNIINTSKVVLIQGNTEFNIAIAPTCYISESAM